jgi:hypothetical protein
MWDGDQLFLSELKKNKDDQKWFADNVMLHRVFICNGMFGRFRHEKETDEEKAVGVMTETVATLLEKKNTRLFFDIVTSPCGVDIAKIDVLSRIPEEYLKAIVADVLIEIKQKGDPVSFFLQYKAEIVSLCAYRAVTRATAGEKIITPAIQKECAKLADILSKYIFNDAT